MKEWRLLGAITILIKPQTWYVGIQGHHFLGIKTCEPPDKPWLTYDPRHNSYQHGGFHATLDEALDDASAIVRKHLDG